MEAWLRTLLLVGVSLGVFALVVAVLFCAGLSDIVKWTSCDTVLTLASRGEPLVCPDIKSMLAYAAGKFYDHLVGISNWQSGDLTTIADAVQRSAFPLAYGRWSNLAERLTEAISQHTYSCP